MNQQELSLPASLFERDAFSAALDQRGHLKCCKEQVEIVDEWLHQQFRDGAPIADLIRLRATFVDQLLGVLWDRHNWGTAGVSLVAVGGYGRGELHPHSDIDILLLVDEDNPPGEDRLAGFVTLLWDLGLQIGHSVRTVAECESNARGDITVLTNLMEARTIRGDSGLMAQVEQQIATDSMWPSDAFFQAKLQEQKARHAKYADTEYNLEPNVKSSPGGLRDLQIIGWIAQRHFGVSSLEELEVKGFLEPEEKDTLQRGREFMWRVRYALHMITDREEDRLLFDHQRELAALWGFVDGERLAVEQFMHTYYRWALALGRLNEVLIQYFDQSILRKDTEDEVRRLNDRFEVRNGYLEVT